MSEEEATPAPVVAVGFDGVIHACSKNWREAGHGAWETIGDPVEGAAAAIASLRNRGFRVVVVSTRVIEMGGARGIRQWLKRNEIEVDDVVPGRPDAVVYIDDRGFRFEGDWAPVLAALEPGAVADLVPWSWKGVAEKP